LLTDEDVRRVQGAKFCPARYAAAAALLKELADRAAERGRQEPLEKEELRPVFCL
jgi:hypothetical protein